MELALAVTVEGSDGPVDIDVDMAELTLEEVARVVELCDGAEPLAELAAGVWNEHAASAIIQVKVERIGGVPIDTMSIDWGEYGPLLRGPDLELEATIPMESDGAR